MKRINKFGELPPPAYRWQIGKTAASINFVTSAETFLQMCQDAKKADLLHEAIQKVKKGSLVFQHWLTAQEYLDQRTP